MITPVNVDKDIKNSRVALVGGAVGATVTAATNLAYQKNILKDTLETSSARIGQVLAGKGASLKYIDKIKSAGKTSLKNIDLKAVAAGAVVCGVAVGAAHFFATMFSKKSQNN